MILFSKEEWRWWFIFKNLHACGDGYQLPPSFETGCSPYSFIPLERKRSATNFFLHYRELQVKACMELASVLCWLSQEGAKRKLKSLGFGTSVYIIVSITLWYKFEFKHKYKQTTWSYNHSHFDNNWRNSTIDRGPPVYYIRGDSFINRKFF